MYTHCIVGSILDYIGDAVLACWNAPQTVENHALKAVENSLRMHEGLNRMRVAWVEKKYPKFYIRCGLHTGVVWVGNVGGTRRMKYSVLVSVEANSRSRSENIHVLQQDCRNRLARLAS